ncbi:TylF/MycF/NovP-related O-methyltransferase [Rhizobium sp. LjRoot254]|uniref:TylF/MycF/NovP-related O-methyltransferase n=1 Tax=Rhizobium sp. LjRoot254 TaxID=3342297 RepID=UPI003ECDF006
MNFPQELKRLVPVKLRVIRSNAIHALRRDSAYYEHEGRREFFQKAFRGLQFNGIPGDYAEFGCCGAMTFRLAYAAARQCAHSARLWAFDSFQGLPPQAGQADSHPMWVEGDMSMSLKDFRSVCASVGMKESDYTAVAGFYGDTLEPAGLSTPNRPDRLALVYIDCDLYSSTVQVLQFLAPRLRHGMVVAFDDYFCTSADAVSGERLAMLEFLDGQTDFAFLPYLPIGWHGMSFIVENRRLLNRAAHGEKV